MPADETDMGARISAFRQRRGLTLEALGAALGMTSQVPSATVPQLADLLGVTICALYGRDEGHVLSESTRGFVARRLTEVTSELPTADRELIDAVARWMTTERERLRAEEGLVTKPQMFDPVASGH